METPLPACLLFVVVVVVFVFVFDDPFEIQL